MIDTNVLMHDPSALFRFDEHDIFLPMIVLEELDNGKKGLSEPARNVRQVSRFLDELLHDFPIADISKGIPLSNTSFRTQSDDEPGRLYIQTENLDYKLPDSLPGSSNDNNILCARLL